jgi:outer membrane protein OmpA-like peptidoglycan-associated protein
MSKIAWILASGAAVLLLGACAENSMTANTWIEENLPQERYQVAIKAEPKGSAFNRHLYEGYIELAERERAEYDWLDSRLFADKALAAAEDQGVPPEALYNWSLPADTAGEFMAARSDLISLLERGTRSKAPADAARAQVSFDCWIQEQQENHQPEDIAACRDGFYAAIAALEYALKPKFVVYFDFNESNFDPASQSVLAEAEAAAKKLGATLSVAGYTDTAGNATYNEGLSKLRADAVAKALVARGISVRKIDTKWYGQSDLAVPTPDDTSERRNRRVVIVVEPK